MRPDVESMEPGLIEALDAMCDDLGLRRLDEVLADPEAYVYKARDGRDEECDEECDGRT